MDLTPIVVAVTVAINQLPGIANVLKLIRGGVDDAKSLYNTGSEISKSVRDKYTETIAKVQDPENKEIDTDRIDAIASLNRSVMPFAFVEYLFYATKLVFLIVMYRYMVQVWVNRHRNSKQ